MVVKHKLFFKRHQISLKTSKKIHGRTNVCGFFGLIIYTMIKYEELFFIAALQNKETSIFVMKKNPDLIF